MITDGHGDSLGRKQPESSDSQSRNSSPKMVRFLLIFLHQCEPKGQPFREALRSIRSLFWEIDGPGRFRTAGQPGQSIFYQINQRTTFSQVRANSGTEGSHGPSATVECRTPGFVFFPSVHEWIGQRTVTILCVYHLNGQNPKSGISAQNGTQAANRRLGVISNLNHMHREHSAGIVQRYQTCVHRLLKGDMIISAAHTPPHKPTQSLADGENGVADEGATDKPQSNRPSRPDLRRMFAKQNRGFPYKLLYSRWRRL